MPTPPPEHPEPAGQDDTPADARLVIAALIRYLRDIEGRKIDGDLELRRTALAAVLHRWRRRLEDES